MLQNRLLLGLLSIGVLLSSLLFIIQPTKAHAMATMNMRHEQNGIVIFGTVKLTDGKPVPGVDMFAAVMQSRGSHEMTRVLASDTTDANGGFKLWVSDEQVHIVRLQPVALIVRPNNSTQYEQDLDLRAGNVASVTIAMRTPVFPIFPFTVFVY